MADVCGVRKKNGEPCRNAAGQGTSHLGSGPCRLHGGQIPGVVKHHQRILAERLAEGEARKLALPIEVDPIEALLGSLFKHHGWVAYWESVVESIEAEHGRLYEPTLHGSGLPTGEAKPHVTYVLLKEAQKERDQVALSLLKVGIDAHRLRLMQSHAQQIAAFGRGLLAQLGIDPASTEARAAFRRQLELVAGGGDGDGDGAGQLRALPGGSAT